jgi:hypothetical protein
MEEPAEIRGRVISVNVKGYRKKSAQLLFSVQTDGPSPKKRSFVVLFKPTHEPQVFTAMASLVTAAHFANAPILVRYEPAVPTDYAIEVQSPPGKAKAVKTKNVVELAGMLHKKGRKPVPVERLSR